MPYTFALHAQFPKEDVMALAARNPLRGREELLIEIGRRSYAAGFYTKPDFVIMCQPPRATHPSVDCEASSSTQIERQTRRAISAMTERGRILSLMRLSGISWRSAAVFLHFTFEDQYPTLAHTALWTWGQERAVNITVDFWWAYVEVCRELGTECHVTMHNLDLALRQFAAEQRGL